MSEALELLNGLTADEIAALPGDEAEPHVIVGRDRHITVPLELKRIAVEHDHNIETVTFDCPRYWDDHDLSTMAVYINYMRSDGYTDSYPVDNIRADGDVMNFDWTISKNVTHVAGKLSFLIDIVNVDEDGDEQNHWHSELNQDMYVSGGMECEENEIINDPDLVSQLLKRVAAVEQRGGAGVLIVDYDYETTKASHTAVEIREHLQNGVAVMRTSYGEYLYLTNVWNTNVTFNGISDDGYQFMVRLRDDGSCEPSLGDMSVYTIEHFIRENADRVLELERRLLVVGPSTDIPGNATHTSKEIYDHIQNGGQAVYCTPHGTEESVYQLTSAFEDKVTFFRVTDDGFFQGVTINAEGYMTMGESSYTILDMCQTLTAHDRRIDDVEDALAEVEVPIKYVESPDADGNLVCLRDLESGTYVLKGSFQPYWGSTDVVQFGEQPHLASIVRGYTDSSHSVHETHIHINDPYTDKMRHYKITNTECIMREIVFSDLASVKTVEEMIAAGVGITVDAELSNTSTNPVQNKVITDFLIRHNAGISSVSDLANDALNAANNAANAANNAVNAADNAVITANNIGDGLTATISRVTTLETQLGSIYTAVADTQPVVFTLTKNGDEYVSSKTHQELLDILAENEHRSITCDINGIRLPLSIMLGNLLVFSHANTIWSSTRVEIMNVGGKDVVTVTNEDHSIEINGQLWDSDDPNADFTDTINGMIDDKIGSIDTALDSIIAMQESLIGGDGV